MPEKQTGIEPVEFIKLATNYMKHLTTLSTGSILIMATFLEKLFIRPTWKGLIVISFAAFTVSIVGAMVGNFLLIASESKEGPKEGAQEAMAVWAGALAV